MALSDSYRVNPKYRGWETECDRLHDQVLLSWKQEARLLTWLGLHDGLSVLELGSGPGFVTGKLLSLLPNSPITTVEIDPQMSKRAQAARGGNQFIGRRLWQILQASGYINLRLEAFVYHSDALGIEAFLSQMNPDRLLPAVLEGSLSPEEFTKAHRAYQHFLTSSNAYILMLGLIACGEKPKN
jgi:SAM-dependent methyltransferase